MIKAGEVVNEYRIPKGYAGIAVRAACEFIMQHPGASQTSVLNAALEKSRLNDAHACWITSPGNPWNGRSPATKLWDRRKVKVFSCYPNEFTALVFGADQELILVVIQDIKRLTKSLPSNLEAGELVRVKSWEGEQNAMFIGLDLVNEEGVVLTTGSSVSDLMKSVQTVKISPKSIVHFKMSNDSGILKCVPQYAEQIERI